MAAQLLDPVTLAPSPSKGHNGIALTAQGSASFLNLTSPKLVKDAPGRLVRINVIVAGSAVGSASDVATVAGVAAANQVFVIPNTVGSYLLDWPCLAGIVVTPGTGQTIAVSFT